MILELQNVNAWYGKGQVLFDLSLGVTQGSVVTVLGRNGVGKSTMMKAIMGLMNARNHASVAGRILFEGRDISGDPTYRNAQGGIAYVPQGRHIFSSLTTKENLLLAQRKRKGAVGEWDLDRIYELFPVLKERGNVMGNRLSGGEQQMLAIARSLMQNSRLLLLDEITEGLAPIVIKELQRVITDLRQRGMSILLAEQNAQFALSCSDHCYILEKGHVVHSAATKDITHDTLSAYLGI